MAQSAKANPSAGSEPNENYARELMQLFSIGLYKLNADGSQMLDSDQQPAQPTYDESVARRGSRPRSPAGPAPPMAALPSTSAWDAPINYQTPMVSVASYHDTTAKLLLNGALTPSGQTPEADLKVALDNVFNHPNVGPFIGKQLIQRLVSSNPSPAYVARVAAVFADNGSGVRGDLAAVVKAILSGRRSTRRCALQSGRRAPARTCTLYNDAAAGSGCPVGRGVPALAVIRDGAAAVLTPDRLQLLPAGLSVAAARLRLAPEFFIQDGRHCACAATTSSISWSSTAAPPADPTVTGGHGHHGQSECRCVGSPALFA